ncbi:PorP/SprF family type IX secretion system membrane protein [Zobellia alginiliquefaciens]|uniref:PorP/SprF family type IX secretion system membrane protein n=1 Tax=Zobellia alginiliquefaciens TaxID=3032586 RepID=UPI0023E45AFF|nr:type IX secretion system membrane protein PorP/SprF [Zobellia alginiliquefaciens]
MMIPNLRITARKLGILVAFLFITAIQDLTAQQDSQYTQYMYNTVSVNPAYAGSRGHLSTALLHRSQWVGLDGAPTTQTFNLHSPIGYRGVGLGLSIVNDKIGPTSETYFDVDFSYTVYTSTEGRLSFGLKGSAHLLDVRFSELNQYTSDSSLQNDIENKFSPNVGAGVYYHNERFYAGLSVPRILQTLHFKDGPEPTTAKEQMNFYLITGYVWDLNDNTKFKPALLTKLVTGAPLQVDVSANFMFSEKFILGAAYRWDAAVSGMVGFNISEKFFIGLAYDREVTELGQAVFNSGSFEAILRYDFISTKSNLKSPRFF